MMATINSAPSSDTPIAIKLALNNGENRRFKLALRELGANTLPDKVRSHSLQSSLHPLLEPLLDHQILQNSTWNGCFLTWTLS